MNEHIHILVVDDNPDNLQVVSGYLKEKGYKLALALNGRNALDVVNSTKIDLILLDVMMPDMDGFEVCSKLKANNLTREIPVIFLTAKVETDDVVKGFNCGGVDYITKPFRKEELFVRVNTHVQLKLMRDFLKEELKTAKESRNAFMKTLLDFGKTITAN
jgi:DNA-binding response OmpR family regulator